MKSNNNGNAVAFTIAGIFILFVVLFNVFTIKVPVGYSAISVDLYAKEVEPKGLHTGRNVVNPITHDFYEFPIFIQQREYEDVKFQDEDGLVISATIGMDYKFDELKIGSLYETYRSSADKITNNYMRTWLKDSVNRASSKYKVDVLYGSKKEEFRQEILTNLQNDFGEKGIVVNNVFFVNEMKLPNQVMSRITAKIEATQNAMQKENELRAVEADAKKIEAEAQGVANALKIEAKGKAEAKEIEANGIAKANKLIDNSLTKELIDYEKVKKWDGAMPKFQGNNDLIVDIK